MSLLYLAFHSLGGHRGCANYGHFSRAAEGHCPAPVARSASRRPPRHSRSPAPAESRLRHRLGRRTSGMSSVSSSSTFCSERISTYSPGEPCFEPLLDPPHGIFGAGRGQEAYAYSGESAGLREAGPTVPITPWGREFRAMPGWPEGLLLAKANEKDTSSFCQLSGIAIADQRSKIGRDAGRDPGWQAFTPSDGNEGIPCPRCGGG